MRRLVLQLAALLVVALLAGTVVSAQAVPARGDIRIIVVTHGTAADPFWSVVARGVDEAAADMGVRVEYRAPQTFDMVQMGLLIDAAVAARPDGLVVSIPDADALEGPIRRAVAAGIPVVSINSGSDVYADLGILSHVGQEEYLAGLGAGRRMAAAGVTKAVCVNHEVGNVGLDLRCQGFLDGLGGQAQVLGVHGDFSEIRGAVEIFLRREADVQGVLALGPLSSEPTLAALEAVGRVGQMEFGAFDLSPSILEALAEGKMSFAIDQQQFLQGYLPVVMLTQYVRYGLMPAAPVQTGPGFVTPGTAGLVMELTEAGIR